MYGDSARAASLLGVESDIFTRYEAALRQAVVDGEDDHRGGGRPLPGDEHQPHDEWAHLDFARRFGATYPDPDEGDEFRWGPNDPPVMNATWSGLPERLPIPSEPARPGGKEIDFDNFPSGDEPF